LLTAPRPLRRDSSVSIATLAGSGAAAEGFALRAAGARVLRAGRGLVSLNLSTASLPSDLTPFAQRLTLENK
jgi:hypothetical protein